MEITEYHAKVRALGCCISHTPAPTLHHCHGGSLRSFIDKGAGLKTSDWLVIPLAPHYHSFGTFAIDGAMGVKAWEEEFGRQVYWLCWVGDHLGIDPFMQSGLRIPDSIDRRKYPREW